MKKLLFFILTMSVCTTMSARVLDFGVTGGMNIAKTEAATENSVYGWTPDSENGWYAGVQFKFSLPVVGLGMDISAVYSENEATLKLSNTETIDQEIGFITVPVHIRWDLGLPILENGIAPFVFTGPQASYSYKTLEDGLETKYKDFEFDSKALIFKWDIGAGILLGSHLQIAYAYEFPLSDTSSMEFKQASETIKEDYKQGTHRIGLTYFF